MPATSGFAIKGGPGFPLSAENQSEQSPVVVVSDMLGSPGTIERSKVEGASSTIRMLLR